MRVWAPIFTAAIISALVSYMMGRIDGERVGRERERVEWTALKDQHDKLMRFVGVCKWSEIMADDIRCKQELP